MPEAPAEARTLLIACGALAREIRAVIAADGLRGLDCVYLPSLLHNRPERIPAAVRAKIWAARGRYARIFVAYADCGTGGGLDRVLAEEGVERIPGPHCYAFYAGQGVFDALAEAEPGTFYLTDFLARQFETLVIRGLGLDRHPELMRDYFGNYRRLVYLAQCRDPGLLASARAAAERLGLAFEWRYTGAGELAAFVRDAADGTVHGGTGHPLLAGHPGAGDRADGAQAREAGAEPALPGGDRPRRDARRPHRHGRLSRGMAPLDA